VTDGQTGRETYGFEIVYNALSMRALKTKHAVNGMIRCGDIAILIFQDDGHAAILDLIKSEIAPLDPPTPKTLA